MYEQQIDQAPLGPRDGEGPMDDETLGGAVRHILTSARQHVEQAFGPARAKAVRYYNGEKFGNEEEGRSQFVLTEVRDGILGTLPNLLRVFFGADRAVEYVPRSPAKQREAEQATDYVNHVFLNENAGFMQSLAVLKDGLRGRLGIFKWGWDKATQPEITQLEGVDEERLLQLLLEPGVTLTSAAQRDEQGLYTAEIRRSRPGGRPWVRALPPEEFWFTPEAVSVDDALCIAHASEKTRGELLALGIPAEVIDAHGNPTSLLSDSEERMARLGDIGYTEDPEAGRANDRILYVEAYPMLDVDGDGIAELRQVCTIGEGYHVVKSAPVSRRPFSVFIPDPEGHELNGQSWADRLMDLQLSKSSVIRAGLDSLSLSIYPRIGVVEGEVNINDVLNTAIGAPIRMRQPGMVQPITHDFVGREAFTVLGYLDEVREARTGQNKGTIGLDADALQSSTRDAVGAAISASQAQSEMLCRIFAESALKPLFRGLLELLVTHQPQQEVVKLRGEWVTVNPAAWDANMGVQVNVALGASTVDTKLAAVQSILAKQEAAMQLLGPNNMLVSLVEYRRTLDYAVRLLGFADSSLFFKPVTEEQIQAATEAARQEAENNPPQQSPEMVIAQAQLQIEQMKTQRELLIKEAELQLKEKEITLKGMELQIKRLDVLLKDDRERDAQAQDAALRQAELEVKAQGEVDRARIQQETELARTEAQTSADLVKNEANNAAKLQQTVITTEAQREQAEIAARQARETPSE